MFTTKQPYDVRKIIHQVEMLSLITPIKDNKYNNTYEKRLIFQKQKFYEYLFML